MAGCAASRSVSAPGLFDPDDAELDRVAASLLRHWKICRCRFAATMRRSSEAARAALRRALGRRLQKRPLVDVHLLRVMNWFTGIVLYI